MKDRRFSLRMKFFLGLSAIAVVLVISSAISVIEYRSMSSYVSDMIADNIKSINIAQRLTESGNEYNLAILAVVGDESSSKRPAFDGELFAARCDSLHRSAGSPRMAALADSVQYSYSAYMLTSLELEDVLQSDFIDTRSWYFERLQPKYNRLRGDLDALTDAIYLELADNSESFEDAFYRSIIPGMVAVLVGLMLVFMLMFFIESNYIRPVYRILASLKAYRIHRRDYKYSFDGDDQLSELNTGISELAEENKLLRMRIAAMKKSQTPSE